MKERLRKVFESGVYYIGDPCYVVRDEDWIPLLERIDYFDADEQTYMGATILGKGTAEGDGQYDCKTRHGDIIGSLPVDAGLIGILPIDVCCETPQDIARKGLGVVVTFQDNFWVDVPAGDSRDGVFHFGHLTVDTNYEEVEEEYEEEVEEETEEETEE
jgi:hypothetical protein